MHIRAHRFGEVAVVQWRWVRVTLDGCVVDYLVDVVSRHTGLDVRGGNVQNFSRELVAQHRNDMSW